MNETISEQNWLHSLIGVAVAQSFNSVVITDASPSPKGQCITYANPAFCSMTGYSENELIGKSPKILQGPLTDPAVIDELRDCLKTGRFFKGSGINYRKDGQPYTVEWNISPVRNESGEITHYVSVQQDVSQLVATQESIQLLAQAMDAAQDGIFITNANGVIEFSNQGFENITGYYRYEVLGKTPNFLKSEEHADRFYKRMWRTIKEGKVFRATVVNVHKEGKKIHCESTISPLLDSSGTITHFVSVIKDLTHRAHRESELREQAMRDGLTSLLNRRAGEVRLESAFLASQKISRPFCVLIADIDHFKKINDTWGHSAGDSVLQSVSSTMSINSRAADSVIRWGGEEFMIVLPYCELKEAVQQAERLRERIENTAQPKVERVTMSIGVAQLKDRETVAELVNRADKALYKAKENGRNRVYFDRV